MQPASPGRGLTSLLGFLALAGGMILCVTLSGCQAATDFLAAANNAIPAVQESIDNFDTTAETSADPNSPEAKIEAIGQGVTKVGGVVPGPAGGVLMSVGTLITIASTVFGWVQTSRARSSRMTAAAAEARAETSDQTTREVVTGVQNLITETSSPSRREKLKETLAQTQSPQTRVAVSSIKAELIQ